MSLPSVVHQLDHKVPPRDQVEVPTVEHDPGPEAMSDQAEDEDPWGYGCQAMDHEW